MVPLKVRAEGQADADPPVKRLRGPDRKLSPQAQRLGRCTISKGWSGKPKRVHAVCCARRDTTQRPSHFDFTRPRGRFPPPHRLLIGHSHLYSMLLGPGYGNSLGLDILFVPLQRQNGTALVFPYPGGGISIHCQRGTGV